MSQQQKEEEQKVIDFLKSRKRIELMEQAVSLKKAKIIRQQQIAQSKTDRKNLSKYLYDQGEENPEKELTERYISGKSG